MNICSVDGCERANIARGLCQKHYDETRRAQRRVSSLAHYHANKAKILPARKEYLAKYRSDHREKLLAMNVVYREANREQARKNSAEWRRAFPMRSRASALAYYYANPEVARARQHTRRAREIGAEGFHTAEQVVALFKKQKGACPICKEYLKKYHKDHIVALANGGSNWIENIQLLCPPCNLSKSAKDPIAFMRERGLLL